MANTTFSVDQIKTQAVKPLYAVAGATELAYEFASGYTTVAQKTAQERLNEVQKSISKLDRDPKALQGQAVSVINARLDELSKDAKKAQSRFEARVTELQKDAQALPGKLQTEIDDAVTELAQHYADLVDRGEKLVAAIRKDGVKAVTARAQGPVALQRRTP